MGDQLTISAWIVQTMRSYGEHTNRYPVTSNVRQRWGQYMFNSLVEVRPDISEQIRGTDADPFYQDKKVEAFLIVVNDLWNPTVKPKEGRQ